MKYREILITAVLVLFLGAGVAIGAADNNALTTADESVEQPAAVISHVEYEFDAVVDGTQVTHDFAVKNTGNGMLEISRVKTG